MKCSQPGCDGNATMRVRAGAEPWRALCDSCLALLKPGTLGRGLLQLERIPPPAGPPAELLSPADYRDQVMAFGVLADKLSELPRVLPRLLASLRAHLAEGGPTGPMIELAEALEPVANLAMRLSRNGLEQHPVSVEDKTRGRC